MVIVSFCNNVILKHLIKLLYLVPLVFFSSFLVLCKLDEDLTGREISKRKARIMWVIDGYMDKNAEEDFEAIEIFYELLKCTYGPQKEVMGNLTTILLLILTYTYN